jgi:hypothetical protein
MPIATHEIGLHGLSGGIFWTILIAVIFYVLGFATVGWEYGGRVWIGLWSTCTSTNYAYDADWFKATQAMITIGLILLIASLITIFLYMFVHSLSMSKNDLIKAFTCLAFIAVVFMVIGFIIFGAKHRYDLNWSFAFCVIGAVFCFVAGILAIFQMKQSNVI